MSREASRSSANQAAPVTPSSSATEMERVRREVGVAIQEDFEAALAAGAEGSRDIVTGWLMRLQWILLILLAAATSGTVVQVLRYDPTIRASAVGPSGDTFPIALREVDIREIEAARARQDSKGGAP